MSVGSRPVPIIVALVLFFVLLPVALAANCTISETGTCSGGQVEVASLGMGGSAHAAPIDFTPFDGRSLCCDANFDEGFYGKDEIFSITTIDGQGHVGAPGVFDYPIEGSFNDCEITQESIDGDEVCIADLSTQQLPPFDASNPFQGHIQACGSGAAWQLQCCPFGWERNLDGDCFENARFVEIIDIEGNADANDDDYTDAEVLVREGYFNPIRANVDWEYESPIEVTNLYRPEGGATIASSGDYNPDLSGPATFSSTLPNTLPAGRYEVEFEAEKTAGIDPQTQNKIQTVVIRAACTEAAAQADGYDTFGCAGPFNLTLST